MTESTADVLTDYQALAVMLFGMQASLGLVGWARIQGQAKRGFPLPPLFPGNHARAVFAGIGVGLALFTIGFLYPLLVRGLLGRSPPSPWDSARAMPVATRFVFLCFGCLGAPPAEEIFFRGYIFGMFKRANHAAAGILTSATLFAAAHFSDPFNLPAIWLFGILLAWVYNRTGSLLASTTAHVVTNGLAITTMFLL